MNNEYGILLSSSRHEKMVHYHVNYLFQRVSGSNVFGGSLLWLTIHDVEWPWPLTSSVLLVADVGCRVTLACVLIWGVGAVDVALTSGHWHPWTPPSSLDQHGIFRSMTTFCPDLSYCLSQNALPEKSPDISAEKQNPRRDLRFKLISFFLKFCIAFCYEDIVKSLSLGGKVHARKQCHRDWADAQRRLGGGSEVTSPGTTQPRHANNPITGRRQSENKNSMGGGRSQWSWQALGGWWAGIAMPSLLMRRYLSGQQGSPSSWHRQWQIRILPFEHFHRHWRGKRSVCM